MRIIDFLQFIQDLAAYFDLYFKSGDTLIAITSIDYNPKTCIFYTKEATHQPLKKSEIEKLLIRFVDKNAIIKVCDLDQNEHIIYGLRIDRNRLVLV
ncbi:hypothetical protein R4Y45_05760 [Holzapfeliella sp. He02]|uniref:Uncharacterized protein n=1 Tax=Holzapfeliella saturejae TaxID=3082953 RepID=A0ABU8SH64_9LACO